MKRKRNRSGSRDPRILQCPSPTLYMGVWAIYAISRLRSLLGIIYFDTTGGFQDGRLNTVSRRIDVAKVMQIFVLYHKILATVVQGECSITHPSRFYNVPMLLSVLPYILVNKVVCVRAGVTLSLLPLQLFGTSFLWPFAVVSTHSFRYQLKTFFYNLVFWPL